mgnify:CR=1 FL=1
MARGPMRLHGGGRPVQLLQATVKRAVDKVPGMSVAVYPSQANFLVIECEGTGLKAESIVAAFAEQLPGEQMRARRVGDTLLRPVLFAQFGQQGLAHAVSPSAA